MASSQAMFLALFISAIAFCSRSVDANIATSMYFDWVNPLSSMTNNGNNLQLALDNTSGHFAPESEPVTALAMGFPVSGVQTKEAFLFGSIQMFIKLVPGNSAGTVTAYYISSTGNNHDEIDFEFLGNLSGQPYIIHTNIYTQGKGNREQQFYPWFDPTADYHNYTIHWNPTEVVWYVDSLPIRVFRNYQSDRIPYPNQQGMWGYCSIWDGESWATRGGLVKTDWKSAPFIARFSNFTARACKWNGQISITQCAAPTAANWWTSPVYSKLSYAEQGAMKRVRDNYMIYDYCQDTKRFNGQMPPECSKPQH